MSLTGYSPRSRQQRNGIIKKKRSNFSGGMSKDRDSSKLRSFEMYHMENIVGFETEAHSRYGTEIFAARRLPFDLAVNFTKSGDTVTVDTALDETYESRFFSLPDERKTWTIITVSEDGLTLTVNNSTDDYAVSRRAEIRSKQNATYFDEFRKRLFKLIGTEIYVSEIEENPSFVGGGTEPRFLMSEWYRLTLSGTVKPFDSVSSFHKIYDDLILINSNGVFRVHIDETLDQMYYWKTNEVIPNPESKPADIDRKGNWDYGRRYIITNSRFRGGNLFGDRTLGFTDNVIEQETPPSRVSEGDKDYTVIYSKTPPGAVTMLVGGNIAPFAFAPAYWADFGKQAFRVFIDNKGVEQYADAYADYSFVTKFEDIVSVTKDAISSAFGFEIEMTMEEDESKKNFVMFSYNNEITPSRIVETPAEDIPTDSEASPLYESTISGLFNMDDNASVIQNRGNVLDGITILDADGNRRSENFTHYSIYGTPEISAAEDTTGQLGIFRTVNDPNIYAWIADIPLIKPFVGKFDISDTSKLFVDYRIVSPYDIGSTIYSESGIEVIIEDFDREPKSSVITPSSVEDYNYFYKVTIVSGEDEINLADGDEIGFAIGVGDSEDVFSAVTTNGQLITSRVFTSNDVGKNVFTSDGTALIIRSVTAGIPTVTDIVGNIGDYTIVCGINPTTRNFNDNVDDFILGSRAKNFPLRNRFFDRVPDTSIGTVSPGFMFLANRGFGEIYYCSTRSLELIGYHNPVAQSDSSIESEITSITEIAGTISVKTEHSTYRMLPIQAFEAGEARFNESYYVIPSPEVTSEVIGCKQFSHVKKIDDNNELVFTNEPAVRFYNGDTYSDNVAFNMIQDSHIKKFYRKLIIDYIHDVGILLYGANDSTGVNDG